MCLGPPRIFRLYRKVRTIRLGRLSTSDADAAFCLLRIRAIRVLAASLFCVSSLVQVCVLPARSAVEDNQIWFVPEDPIYRSRRHFPAQDYIDLFARDAEWPVGKANIQVLGIATQMVEMGPDALLSSVISFVSNRQLALDVELHMNTYGHDDCGHIPYIESYAAPGIVKKDMERLQKLGADVRYVTMDEPLWFGHEFNGSRNACHDEIEEVARRVSVSVADVKKVFPNARIGQVEPFTGTRPDWPAKIRAWLEAYRAATGEYPAYFHADVSWSNPVALNQLIAIATHVRSLGIRFGVIYNGDSTDVSGEIFNDKAISRFKYVEAALGWRPDAIIMSWTYAPERNLPEGEVGTMTNLLRSYVQWINGS